MLKSIRYFLQGCLAYLIARIHDYYEKHYGQGWVYIPWKTTLKEHIQRVRKYYEKN